MKTEALERDIHMEGLIWKATLQKTEETLKCIEKNLYRAKLNFDAIDTDDKLGEFTQTASHYSERIKRLKQRVARFENKLTLLNECDTSQCDTAFFEEAEDISIEVKNCSKNVKVLSSDISYYTDSIISD